MGERKKLTANTRKTAFVQSPQITVMKTTLHFTVLKALQHKGFQQKTHGISKIPGLLNIFF